MEIQLKELKILAPTGILGYGFPEQSFRKGLARKPDAIVADAGSTDAGPHKLGAGVGIVSDTALSRDLEMLIVAGAEENIPVLIGSVGGAGSRKHVEHNLELIREIINRRHLETMKTCVIWADIDRELVAERLNEGKVQPLNSNVPLLTEERLAKTDRIVAQMGYEPILKALQAGYQLVICGRAYDPSPFAAVTAYHGLPLSYGFHIGKILECAALCAVPGTTKDCMLGIVHEDGFEVEPLADSRKCTPLSVAAHTFYEKEHPYLLHGPGVVMNLENCTFEPITDRRVYVCGSRLEQPLPYKIKLEGAMPAAYRTFTIAGIRDPLMIADLKQIEQAVEQQVRTYYSEIFNEEYQINFYNYGINGVLGDNEPDSTLPHEVGLLFEAIAPRQEMADAICGTLRSTLLHYGYENRKATAGNLAFPFSPSDVSFGKVYEFSVYHLMELLPGEETELFPIEKVEWRKECSGYEGI